MLHCATLSLVVTELMLCAGLEQQTVQLRQLLEAERAHVTDLESNNLKLTHELNYKAEQQLMMGKQVQLQRHVVCCVLCTVRPVSVYCALLCHALCAVYCARRVCSLLVVGCSCSAITYSLCTGADGC